MPRQPLESFVESLQLRQRILDLKPMTPQCKARNMGEGARNLKAGIYLGERALVTCARAVARDVDDDPDEGWLIPGSISFMGNVAHYSYLFKPEEGLDSYAVGFNELEPLDDDPQYQGALRRFTFQVPVLALNACLSMDH